MLRIRGAAATMTETVPRRFAQPRILLPAESYFEIISALAHFSGVSLLQ